MSVPRREGGREHAKKKKKKGWSDVGSLGTIGQETNQSRMEYVESKLASHAEPTSKAGPTTKHPGGLAAPPSLLEAQKPTMRGKLMEIDLGEEARSRNVALTEKAQRRLAGQPIEEEEHNGPARKVRLGRDGKPWRGRNRRGSDDIKRDEMVDKILHENRRKFFSHCGADAHHHHPRPCLGGP